MIDPLKYASAREFRQALDAKVKVAAATSGVSHEDLRRQIVFNRFLARLDFSKFILTGGYSLELRLPLSRSTTDIDLSQMSFFRGWDSKLNSLIHSISEFFRLLKSERAHFYANLFHRSALAILQTDATEKRNVARRRAKSTACRKF